MAEIRFEQAAALKKRNLMYPKLDLAKSFRTTCSKWIITLKQGWHDPRIVPYRDISVSPANCTLHYGQAIFEGMKAFRTR